jgi:OmpA-OmpF porin, OOP family
MFVPNFHPRKKMNKTTMIATVALFMALPAQAHWYAGATAGESRTKINGDNLSAQFLDFGYSDAQTQTNTRGTAFRVYGGYQLNRYIGVEAGYADLGKSSIRTNVVPTGTFERRIKTTGLDVSVVSTLPVTSKFALFARAGAFMSERKTSFATSGDVELLAGVQGSTERQTKATFGAGATYDFTTNIALRAEATQTRKYADELLSQNRNIDTYSIGVQYRFR